jgi:hypothetical protein
MQMVEAAARSLGVTRFGKSSPRVTAATDKQGQRHRRRVLASAATLRAGKLKPGCLTGSRKEKGGINYDKRNIYAMKSEHRSETIHTMVPMEDGSTVVQHG